MYRMSKTIRVDIFLEFIIDTDVIQLINTDLIRATRLNFFPKFNERTSISYLRVLAWRTLVRPLGIRSLAPLVTGQSSTAFSWLVCLSIKLSSAGQGFS